MLSKETFDHDAAGNVTEANGDAFVYDTNNRLISFNGQTVSYDLDGNMLSNGVSDFTYDPANRLISAGGHTYTYNAENVRIRDLCSYEETIYTYDTNCKLSRLLVKTTNGTETKYVYGRGLIGEEKYGSFKVYHFDCRGSTIAITDMDGYITDTFKYDTYGKLIERTGYTDVIFGYNGRDGVITEGNGLIFMRARYYSPDMKRFINADIVAGQITNAVTLNRFAYANGNPVSFVDPFGLWSVKGAWNSFTNWVEETVIEPVANVCERVKDSVTKEFNDARQKVNETREEVRDRAVDTYENASKTAFKTYNGVKSQVNSTQLAIESFGEKTTTAFFNSIEGEAGVGYGVGFSHETSGIEVQAEAYADTFTVRLEDSELFMENSGTVGISADVMDQEKLSIGITGSYHHDYNDRPNDCEEHDAWSNPFDVATCEHAEKQPITITIPIIGALNVNTSKDIVIGFSTSMHLGVGYHCGIGINVSQFFRELC